MTAFNFHHRQTLRWWYAGATLMALAFFAVFYVVGASADLPGGCDFSPANNGTASCQNPLTGSTFAGGDGNLLTSPTTFGTTDWQNVAGLNKGIDLPSGTTDNSFGQGTKTDNASVSVVTGSIPPNKSDLTRFYEASEVGSNNHNFLYLAFERSNVLGTVNMNFEINQKTQPDLTTAGAKTLNRTAGDLLVTYDFSNGGGRPTIAILRWLTSATVPAVLNTATNTNFSPNVCLASNTFPCWGDQQTLDGADSIAAVNNLDTVTDPIPPNNPRDQAALTFGETAIDLTASGVFPSGTCAAFGSTMVTSRSSAAFGSEVKDFIAPVPVNISNCGTVNIIKHTDPRGVDQNFSYTSTIPNPASGSTTPNCTNDATPSAFTLNDHAGVDPASPITAGTDNTEHCANVPAGSYTVTEGAEPANFTLEGLTCTATGTGSSGSQDGTTPAQADITVAPGGVVTCTYTNQTSGAILVTKTAKVPGTANTQPLAGASFTVNGVSKTTDANGQACFGGLAIGTAYTVTETAAPSGYAIDTTSKSVTPTSSATCSGVGTPDGVSFTDSPLTDLAISATAEVAGASKSTITCKNASNANIGNSPQGPADPASVSATGLKPGTYTCTVVIDP